MPLKAVVRSAGGDFGAGASAGIRWLSFWKVRNNDPVQLAWTLNEIDGLEPTVAHALPLFLRPAAFGGRARKKVWGVPGSLPI